MLYIFVTEFSDLYVSKNITDEDKEAVYAGTLSIINTNTMEELNMQGDWVEIPIRDAASCM